MRTLATALALGLVLSLAACGDEGDGDARAGQTPTAAGSTPSASATDACVPTHPDPPTVDADVDGDGSAETVQVLEASGGCPASLATQVGTDEVSAVLAGDLPVDAGDVSAVQLPDRDGELLLVQPHHPRGGFETHLYGYADGVLEELTVDGEPIFSFIATDVMSTPTAVSCVAGGFEARVARRHEPIGVLPAWDVFRTAYSVDGNEVTKGATTEVADNITDEDLEREHADLVAHEFFADCAAG